MKPHTFQQFLRNLTSISEEAITEIEASGIRKSVKASAIFFSASGPFSKLLFLEKGLVRSYRVIDGKDITFYFFTVGEFAVDYESFLKESGSSLFFEALVDCDYLEFSKPTIEALYDLFPVFERVGRIMAEQAYLSATSRVKELQAESLQDRYLKLLARNPELFQQIPQYHIASYLGVKPQSLSRVRAKLTGKIY
ncbi:MAG: Crp/Fnr family transcriptional regulator [Bacteroidota bacterium]